MSNQYKGAVFIGRFQPLHNGHMHNIETALQIADRLVIIVGSSLEPRTYKNPFTFQERKEMIMDSLPVQYKNRVTAVPVKDLIYNETKWAASVQEAVERELDTKHVVLIGHEKDSSSYYLKNFPQWALYQTDISGDLNATDVRSLFFKQKPEFRYFNSVLPPQVIEFLNKFKSTEAFTQVCNERTFIEKYKQQFSSLPYPPVFVTTDAVVTCAGHVLMIKRKSYPGKGLYALPGGFLNADSDSSVLSAMIRELREETRIAVPAPVLEGSINGTRVFDALNRSARGRTITHAFSIKLKDTTLPKVKGADDAVFAKWIPVANIRSEECFEDHYEIIQWAISI